MVDLEAVSVISSMDIALVQNLLIAMELFSSFPSNADFLLQVNT